jgi:hypothetical protein
VKVQVARPAIAEPNGIQFSFDFSQSPLFWKLRWAFTFIYLRRLAVLLDNRELSVDGFHGALSALEQDTEPKQPRSRPFFSPRNLLDHRLLAGA